MEKDEMQTLREMPKYFETLAKYSQDWDFLLDKEYNVLYMSQLCLQISGYNEEDFKHDKGLFKRIIHNDDKCIFENYLKEVCHDNPHSIIDIRIKCRNETVIWIEHHCQMVYDRNHKHIGYRGFNKQINKRVELEEQLVIFSDIINKCNSMVVMTDTDGNIEFVNQVFQDITGYSEADVLGKNPRILKTSYTHATIHMSLWNTIKSGNVWEGEFVNTKKSGEIYFEKAVISQRYDSEKNVLGYIAVKQTFSEKNKNKQTQECELKEFNVKRDKILSILFHDLRAPIGTLTNLIEILRTDHGEISFENRERIIVAIQNSLMNSYSLIENLIPWAINRTKHIYNPQKNSVLDLLNNTKGLLLETAKFKNIEIEVCAKNDLIAFCDKEMIATILRNLVSNAIKFTEPKGCIKLCSIESDNTITILVKDNGIGMSENKIEKMFELLNMKTSLGTNNEKGFGIGLLICKDFIDEHSAKLLVKSKLGVGTTFEIVLNKV